MTTKPKTTVVTLCGSTKFMDEFRAAYERETLAGRVVISVGVVTSEDLKDHPEYRQVTEAEKTTLDRVHFRKIDISDEILVLNKGGYIGDSTAREIRYALLKGKGIRWLEPYHDRCANCGKWPNWGRGAPCQHCSHPCSYPYESVDEQGRAEFTRRWQCSFVDPFDNPKPFPPIVGVEKVSLKINKMIDEAIIHGWDRGAEQSFADMFRVPSAVAFGPTPEEKYADALLKVDRLKKAHERAQDNVQAAQRREAQAHEEVEKASSALNNARKEWEKTVLSRKVR